MDSIVSQKLVAPVFEFTTPDLWRSMLAANLAEYDSLQAAFYSGLQAATPGMAFLFGYQAAIRCLDPSCAVNKLAAVVISEKGIKSPKDFKTGLQNTPTGWLISGEKSHAMLVPDHLDCMYLVAKQQGNLVGIRLDNIAQRMADASQGLTIISQVKSPFVQDIPHAAIRLNDVQVDELMVTDGHKSWNKPFRYWEDMHVASAMLAWMYRWASQPEALLLGFQQLQQSFKTSPDYYRLTSFELLDGVLELLDQAAHKLPESKQTIWQQDRLLLQMGSNIRKHVKAKMVA